jgi:hypothetical protein
LFETSERKTAIVEATSDSAHLLGQFIHSPESRLARLTFLQLEDSYPNEGLVALIDFLSYQAGESRAINLLAEVEDSSLLFEPFRHAGFSAYGIETVWRIPQSSTPSHAKLSAWLQALPKDEVQMRCLYQNVTPPLEQAAEPYQSSGYARLMYSVNNEVVAWVNYQSGSLGTYLVPVLHPSLKEPALLFQDLFEKFSDPSRSVYIRVRSHQSWLASSLETLGAEPIGQFMLLVKHLAVSQKAAVTNEQRARADSRQAKPTVPILRNLTPGDTLPENKNGLK